MEYLSPFAKQILIAAAPQLAAISVGGVVGYPNVLLEQFKSNHSSIHVDLDMSTWIGSAHGIAGLPSVLMPVFMQWRGRKPAFMTCCLIILTGWIITILAKSATTVLIAEACHGLGTNGIIIVSFSTISEMVDPKFRLISMSFYTINEAFGISSVSILGRYLHWKIVGYIMSVPIFVALVISFVWPESPSWLAFKGDFQRCEDSFLWLRGSDADSRKELKGLINSQNNKKIRNVSWSQTLSKIARKDFILPSFQVCVCLSSFYCSGTLVLLIYAMDMIRTATGSELAAFYGMITLDIILYLGSLFNVVLLKMFNNKIVFLCSGLGSAVCLFMASLVSYLQTIGVLSSDSFLCLYFLIVFMVVISLGVASMAFTVSAELMPVKHRDLGGAIYVILTCVLHFSSLKGSPYLFLYLGLWGTLLLFAFNATFCALYIWNYFPETKNRSLQEIEYFYNHGSFENQFDLDFDENGSELISINQEK